MGKNADKHVEREQEALESVATPPLTLGRIVHFNIGTAEEQVLRAAIVVGTGMLHVYLALGDVPFYPGTKLRPISELTAIAVDAAEGDGMGEWRWPQIPTLRAVA